MLFLHIPAEGFEGGAWVSGDVDGGGGLGGPVASGQHAHGQVHARQVDLRLLDEGLELVVDAARHGHVLEHALQLRRELATALRLQAHREI